ncbi:MAG TPA: hypothetical protein VNA19_16220 [Pyrinomonadaceae bacterium]|jgi:hypothetical protein|nr:hypothetical protein [Pyrinomonadaceae bacterium]
MWKLAAALSLSLVCAVNSSAQSRPASNPPLQLTTRLLTRRFCPLSEQLDALQLKLELRYTNTSERPVILYRGKNLFYQTYISRRAIETGMESGASASPAKPFELVMTHARYWDERREEIERDTPGKVFVVLAPRGVFLSEQVISIPVAREAGAQLKGAVAPGEQQLRLTVSSWYEARSLAEKLRQRWHRHGLLWADPLASAPMHFTVEQRRSLTDCQ